MRGMNYGGYSRVFIVAFLFWGCFAFTAYSATATLTLTETPTYTPTPIPTLVETCIYSGGPGDNSGASVVSPDYYWAVPPCGSASWVGPSFLGTPGASNPGQIEPYTVPYTVTFNLTNEQVAYGYFYVSFLADDAITFIFNGNLPSPVHCQGQPLTGTPIPAGQCFVNGCVTENVPNSNFQSGPNTMVINLTDQTWGHMAMNWGLCVYRNAQSISTMTPTSSTSATKTQTPTPTKNYTATYTPTLARSSTMTQTKTPTPTPGTPTITRTFTSTLTFTFTRTITKTYTATVGTTPTRTQTPTPTGSTTVTKTFTPGTTTTMTQTPTPTGSTTVTKTYTPGTTVTMTQTPTPTGSTTVTKTNTPGTTVTMTQTPTPTGSTTATLTYTFTNTKTATYTPTPTGTNTPIVACCQSVATFSAGPQPYGDIAVDWSRNMLYVVNTIAIYELNLQATPVATVNGLQSAYSVAIQPATTPEMYVGNNMSWVEQVNPDTGSKGASMYLAGTVPNGDIVVDPSGRLFVTTTTKNTVNVYQFQTVTTTATPIAISTPLTPGIKGMLLDGNALFVSNPNSGQIVEIKVTPSPFGLGGPTPVATLASPQFITRDGAGNYYVSQKTGYSVYAVPTPGVSPIPWVLLSRCQTGVSTGMGIATDASGQVYLEDNTSPSFRIVKYPACYAQPTLTATPALGMSRVIPLNELNDLYTPTQTPTLGLNTDEKGTFTDTPTSTTTPLPTSTVGGPALLLAQTWPNVSDGKTRVTFHLELARPCRIKLTVLNLVGEPVFQVIDMAQSGDWEYPWDVKTRTGAVISNGFYMVDWQVMDGPELTRRSTRLMIKR